MVRSEVLIYRACAPKNDCMCGLKCPVQPRAAPAFTGGGGAGVYYVWYGLSRAVGTPQRFKPRSKSRHIRDISLCNRCTSPVPRRTHFP